MPPEVRVQTTAIRPTIAQLFSHLDEGQLDTVQRDRGRADVTPDRLARACGASAPAVLGDDACSRWGSEWPGRPAG